MKMNTSTVRLICYCPKYVIIQNTDRIKNHDFEYDNKEVYIGLTSLNETSGKYHWVDGSPLNYPNWKKGRGLG